MTNIMLFSDEENYQSTLQDAIKKLPTYPRLVIFVSLHSTGIISEEQRELQNMILEGIARYSVGEIHFIQGNVDFTMQTLIWGIEYNPEDSEYIIAYVSGDD